MKKLEVALGALAGLAFAMLAFFALFILGTFIYKGPAPDRIYPATALAPSQAPGADDAAAPDAPTPDPQAAEAAAEPAGAIDLAAGEKLFKACKACHTVDKGGKNTTGPHLWGVYGRPAASVADYKYSDALKALDGAVWDDVSLDAYLQNPKAYAKGTKMSYPGMKAAGDRANLIGWLALQSDTPVTLAAAGAPDTGGSAPAEDSADDAAPDEPYADLADDDIVTLDPVPYPEGVTYQDVPPLTEAEMAAIAEKVAALEAALPAMSYENARQDPIHFQPGIAQASSAECLVCHSEVIAYQPRAEAPAGNAADESLAWYQTLDTYEGPQASFHWRHLESGFAKQVMNLECNFCHKGNDPREESPDMMPGRDAFLAAATPEFTLRKMVNPSETCLLCHGAMPDPVEIMGLSGPWPEVRHDMEYAEAPNGCLSCHAESFRTNRHQVNYLNAATIEDLARNGTSDTCYGCHGGRQWYRISYPYPRTPWPGMDTETVPDWAKDRPTEQKPEHQIAQ